MKHIQRYVLPAVYSAILIGLIGCATCPTSRIIHATGNAWNVARVAQFVHEHPVPAGAPFRLDEISRTTSASLHIAQIRGAQALHSHRAHDLAAIVRSGHGDIRIDSQVFSIASGDVIELPRGTRHAVISHGLQPLVAVVVFTPPFDGQDVVGEK